MPAPRRREVLMYRFATVFALFIAVFPAAARASCTQVANATCAPEGIDLCTYDPQGSWWTCDFAPYAVDTVAVDAHVQSVPTATLSADLCTTNGTCAWGTDSHGNPFCCEESAQVNSFLGYLGDLDDVAQMSDSPSGGYLDLPTSAGFMGGLGNDEIYGSTATTMYNGLYGEDGDDLIVGSAGYNYIWAGPGADTVYGGDSGNYIYGEEGGDTIFGGNAGDLIYGDAGADVIHAGNGGDFVYGGPGQDKLFGEGGHDELYGEAGDDVLDGGNYWDTLCGGPDQDTLRGGGSNDLLDGGLGTNNLDGGPGVSDQCASGAITSNCEVAVAPFCP